MDLFETYLAKLQGKTYAEAQEAIHMWVRRGKIDAKLMMRLCVDRYKLLQQMGRD